MRIAISTASAYSDSLKLALESNGEEVEIMNSWGERHGLKRILDNPNIYKALLLQWPEALLQPTELSILDSNIINSISSLIKEISDRGVKVIFTFHNLIPHEYDGEKSIGKNLYNSIIVNSTTILHHSNAGYIKALKDYPVIIDKENFIFRHPPYYFVNQHRKDVGFVRSIKLDLKKKYFLSIGSIVEYKKLGIFVNTLNTLNPDQYGLIIAGKSYDNSLINLSSHFQLLLNKGYDIKVLNKWLSNNEISNLVKISDYLVCNNSNDRLTSGIPHLCEAGQKLLYSDIENDYLKEIAQDFLITSNSLEDSVKRRICIKELGNIYEMNKQNIVGKKLKEIIFR